MARKPTGIDKRLEQYRPPVIKAEGVTDSERYLAKLADKSFLNLWSYPSLFRDQKQSGSGDGKELCDLLVVCDRQIIIFSEKTIAWPNGELDVAWRRWAKRAVCNAAKQAKGAERWITKFPDRIFLDRGCKTLFPIDLPSPEDRVIHRVVVAKGAAQACREHVPSSSGSMIIKPAIKGNEHWLGAPGKTEPFSIGDVDPSGSFVHVIDDVALDVIMGELDTIRDFTDYLDKKAVFVRSGRLSQAHGEENLLAYYAVRINDEGDHDFVPDGEKHNQVEIDRSLYTKLRSDARYVARKQAEKISYLWDELIKIFTTHMIDGTSITPDGYEFDLKQSELGVRYMALETSFCPSEPWGGGKRSTGNWNDEGSFLSHDYVSSGRKRERDCVFHTHFQVLALDGTERRLQEIPDKKGRVHTGLRERYIRVFSSPKASCWNRSRTPGSRARRL